MEKIFHEEFEVDQFDLTDDKANIKRVTKPVIGEISLKIVVNGDELFSILCSNQDHEELALGLLYNEGLIKSFSDVDRVVFNEKLFAVSLKLKDGVKIERTESLRSLTSGCGRCYTYINPLKREQYRVLKDEGRFSLSFITSTMSVFVKQSEAFKIVGGVHSALLHSGEKPVFVEDIGRHNCIDKIAGHVLKEGRLERLNNSVMFISGRISSEIISKVIRLGIPIIASKSTPTSAAIKLAEEYKVSLLGYVRGNSGYIYTHPKRLIQ